MKSWEDWQKPYQFGILVIWPPDEVRTVVNSQRERIDPVSGSYTEGHITVTQPLSRGLDDEEWKKAEGIISGFDSFEIGYGPLKNFFPYPCIWYEIQPAGKVLEIRRALHQTGFFNLDIDHPRDFIPHMTITEGLSGPEVNESLFHTLQLESGQGSFQCSDIAFILPNRDFKFQVRKVLPLS